MSVKVFYVGATSELEASWRWEQNVKHGTDFIASADKGWVDEEVEKINVENVANNPESGAVIRLLHTYKITVKIEEQ